MDQEKFKNYKTKKIENTNTKCDFTFKVEFIGDCKVGKTSITKQLTNNKFQSEYIPTKGYEFYPYIIKIEDIFIKFQLWDMCGEENYHSALLNLYRNASIGVLIYSITDYKSFQNLDSWINEMKKYAPNSKIILLGNKADDEEKREVSYDDGKNLSIKYNLDLFMEVSAKNGFNSPNFMEIAAIELYEESLLQSDKTDNTALNNSESIILSQMNGKRTLNCCF